MDVELLAIRDFLATQPPFDALSDSVLSEVPARMRVRYARRGTPLMSLGQPNDDVFVLRSGAVDIRDATGALVERGDIGTCFGTTTVMEGRPSQFSVVTIEDSLMLVLGAEQWHVLAGENPAFRRFFVEQRQARMRGALAFVHGSETGSAILRTRVGEMAARAPVCSDPQLSIRAAAQLMSQQDVSSLLIVEDGKLVGILTDRDLRSRVLAAGVDPQTPVGQIMTPEVATAAPDDLAFEVLLRMMDGRIHHIPVWSDEPAPGRASGVITSTDLVRLEHANPVYLVRDIAAQSDLAGLSKIAQRLPGTVGRLLSQDATADDIGRVVTAIGDGFTRALIALAQQELGPAPVPYAWVALGSQARMEQVLGSDQDHAIVIADTDTSPLGSDEAATVDVDAYFAELAERVVAGLEECGYPRCPGDVMATAASCRMRARQWREAFAGWIREPDPQAVLATGIFFDARTLAGDAGLVTPVLSEAVAGAADSPRFLALLARHAVSRRPPLGFFRNFVLSQDGDQSEAVDLKWGGVGAIQEAARVLALSAGSTATGTSARLDAAVNAGQIGAQRAADLKDAYEFLAYTRLRRQLERVRAGLQPDNSVRPDDLSAFEKRHLKDAFGTIRAMQTFIERSFASAGN